MPAATAEDLLIMKLLAGRPRDAEDARGLVIAQGDQLDWDYCLNVARDLGAAIDIDLTAELVLLRDKTT